VVVTCKDSKEINLEEPAFYNNRELSWLSFNQRVLEEAIDKRNPLLERYKFLAIFSSNLDEVNSQLLLCEMAYKQDNKTCNPIIEKKWPK
jgi:polyphosphate kinase